MFISVDKMKQLREQAKNGDERARQILNMQMNNQDFSSLLEEHFKPIEQEPVQEKPATQVNPEDNEPADERLKKFLEFNGVKEGDEDYDATVESFYEEYPNLRPKQPEQEPEQTEEEQKGLLDDLSNKIKDLLGACDQAIMNVADDNENDITGATLKGTLSTLQEVKQSALDAFEKIKTLKGSIAKKQEPDIM